MTSTRQLELNTRESFSLARNDIAALFDHVTRLHNVVLQLHADNITLNTKLNGNKFVASKSGKKLHISTCAYAKNIKAKNKLVFTSRPSGYLFCKCLR